MDNHVSGKFRIFGAGFACSRLDLNIPFVGCNVTFEAGPKNVHKRLFNRPFVAGFVQQSLESEFPRYLLILIQLRKSGHFDGADPYLADNADLTLKVAVCVNGFWAALNLNSWSPA
jgi:hypothetical protein